MVHGLVIRSWSYVGKGGKTESLNKVTQSHQVNEVGGSHPVPEESHIYQKAQDKSTILLAWLLSTWSVQRGQSALIVHHSHH